MKAPIIGIIIWLVAAVMLLFQALTKVVTSIDDIYIFSIEEIFGLAWTEQIPWVTIREWSVVVAQTHISIVLLAVGLIFIIWGMFQKVR